MKISEDTRWMDRWMDGWMGVKAKLWIAKSYKRYQVRKILIFLQNLQCIDGKNNACTASTSFKVSTDIRHAE